MESPNPHLIVVGGGIAGSAVALRAAQYELSVIWIRGTAKNAKRSRGKYVHDIDNMLGVHPDIVLGKAMEWLEGEEFAAARERLAAAHLHIGTSDIVENARQRIERDYADYVQILDEEAVGAARDGAGFRVTTAQGTELRAGAMVLATGVMDSQPSIKKTLKSGRVKDDVLWVYPYANQERLLYCVRCEGHLTRDTPVSVIGSAEGAAQIALMMSERYGTQVTVLTNGEELGAKAETRALLERREIEVRAERIVDFVDEGPDGVAEGPKGSDLHAVALEGGDLVPARHAIVALGIHQVYNELAQQLGAELEDNGEAPERRHVLIEDASSETDVANLFAVGDLARRRDGGPLMKQVYTAQEYAVRAVDTIDRRRRLAAR